MAEMQRETANDAEPALRDLSRRLPRRARGNAHAHSRSSSRAWVSTLSSRDLVAILYPLTPINAVTFSRNHDGTAGAIRNFEGRKYDYTPRNAYEERYQMQPPQTQEQMRNDLVDRGAAGRLHLSRHAARRAQDAALRERGDERQRCRPASTTTGLRCSRGSATTASVADVQAVLQLDGPAEPACATCSTRRRAPTPSIYTLDPRGLTTEEFDIADNVDPATNRSDPERVVGLAARPGRSDRRPRDRRPERSAARTAARWCATSARTTCSAIPRRWRARDGKFHEIKVSVKRRDVEVRARKGYWAFTPEESRAGHRRAQGRPAARNRPGARGAGHGRRARGPAPGRRSGWARSAARPKRRAVTLAWEVAARRADGAADAVDRINDLGDVDLRRQAVQRPGARAIRRPSVPSGQVTFDAPPAKCASGCVSREREGAAPRQRRRQPTRCRTSPRRARRSRRRSSSAAARPEIFRSIRAGGSAVPTATRQFSRTERLLLRFDVYGPAGTTPTLDAPAAEPHGRPHGDAAGAHESTARRSRWRSASRRCRPATTSSRSSPTSGTDSARHLLGIRITG